MIIFNYKLALLGISGVIMIIKQFVEYLEIFNFFIKR
jgi:hypothetical protein